MAYQSQTRRMRLVLSVIVASLAFGSRMSPARDNTHEKGPAWRYQLPAPSLSDSRDRSESDEEDAYFDKWFGSASPLESPQVGQQYSSASAELDSGDFPLNSSNVIVVAHFNTWNSYLSSSHRSVYTIVNLQIDRVIADKTATLAPGEIVQLAIPGGTVSVSDKGKTLSWGIRAFAFPCEPGPEYLMFLSYRPKQVTFLEYEKAWLVDHGTLQPVSRFDIDRHLKGEPSHAGSSLESAIQEIQSRK